MVSATISNGDADIVLGQQDLQSSYINVIENNRFNGPAGIYISDGLWVVDRSNNRVVFLNESYATSNGESMEGVIGQTDFNSGKPNRGGAAANNTLNQPCGVAEDTIGGHKYVWIADCGNNRVLRFTDPPNIGATADMVLGQTNFTSTMTNRGGSVAANTLNLPVGVDVNRVTGDVWVADEGNARVLKYSGGALSSGMDASLELGQPAMTSDHNCIGPTATCLADPTGVRVNPDNGDVWVLEPYFNRALRFPSPSSDYAAADIVLGQQNFTSGSGGTTANTLNLFGRGGPRGPGAGFNGISLVHDATDYLLISDAGNNRVLKYTSPYTSGQNASVVFGQNDFTSNSFNFSYSTGNIYLPVGVYGGTNGYGGNIWTIDYNSRILSFANTNISGSSASLVLGAPNFSYTYINSVEGKGFYYPNSIVYDPKYKRIFVSDLDNNRVLWWNNASPLFTQRPADGVIGQTDFYSNQCSAAADNKICNPGGVAVDAEGNLYVADEMHNRVLRFSGAGLATGMSANLVLGQSDFVSGQANRGGAVSAGGMYQPVGVHVDSSGNVWVADEFNHRVLGFSAASLTNGADASFVLGQADFASNSCNRGNSNPSDNSLCQPTGVFQDSSNNVWVADMANSRILKFNGPISNGQSASLVLGQGGFNSSSISGANQNSLNNPYAATLDMFGNVWVPDYRNNRIMEYAPPFSNGMTATNVIGQPNFTSGSTNRGGYADADTLNWPTFLTFDDQDNLYAADSGNNRVTIYSSGLSATGLNPLFISRSSSSLTASWDNVPGADYVVVLSSVSSFSPAKSSSTITSNSKDFSALDSSTTYYFKVKLATETDISFSLNEISTATLAPAPSVSSIAPSSGTVNTSVDITDLTGTGFQNGAAVKLTRTGQTAIAATIVGFVNSTELTCTLPLAGAATGQWNILVVNPDGQSGELTDGFAVNDPPPVPTAIAPNTGSNGAPVSITDLAGTGFQNGATVKLVKTGEFDINATNVTVESTLKITCVLPISGKTTGAWDVVVTNPDGQSGVLSGGFTITPPAPTILNIAPSSGMGSAVHIVIDGANFTAGTTVKLSKTGQTDIQGTNVVFVSAAQVACDLDLSGAAGGQWDVALTVPGLPAAVSANAFLVLAPQTEPAKVYGGVFDPASGGKSYVVTHISTPGRATVKIYDSLGRLIRTLFDGDRNAGSYSDEWDGKNTDGSTVASGVYLIRIEGPGVKTTKRVLVVK